MSDHNPLGNKVAKQIAGQTDDVEDALIDILNALGGGFLLPTYDNIDLTYVASGNGEGEIETVVFSLSGTPVATLTLSYNGEHKLINVIKT